MTDQLPTSPSPSDEAHQALLDSLQEQLFSAGASFSEQAFGIGCSAALIPMAIILFITFLFGNRSWTGLAITGIIELLLALALVNIFAIRARQGALSRAYHGTIEPQIQAYLAENQLSLSDFQQVAARALPQGAILREKILSTSSLPASPPVEIDAAKE